MKRTDWDFRKIMVGIDFSSPSSHAFDFSIKLAQRLHAEIIAVLVKNVDDLALAIRQNVNVNLRNKAMLTKEVDNSIQQKYQSLRQKYGQNYDRIRFIVTTGKPWVEILKLAGKEGCGLIVTGTRGRSALTNLILGSTARELVHYSTCPVITVNPKSNHRPRKAARKTSK